MQLRITFRSEVYIDGDSIDDIRDKWETLPLYSAVALQLHEADYVELTSVERVDDGSYDDVTTKFKNWTTEALINEQ